MILNRDIGHVHTSIVNEIKYYPRFSYLSVLILTFSLKNNIIDPQYQV